MVVWVQVAHYLVYSSAASGLSPPQPYVAFSGGESLKDMDKGVMTQTQEHLNYGTSKEFS
jgi:hypothetical protein